MVSLILYNLLLNKSNYIKRCRKAGSNDKGVLSQQLWLSVGFNFCLYTFVCVCILQ